MTGTGTMTGVRGKYLSRQSSCSAAGSSCVCLVVEYTCLVVPVPSTHVRSTMLTRQSGCVLTHCCMGYRRRSRSPSRSRSRSPARRSRSPAERSPARSRSASPRRADRWGPLGEGSNRLFSSTDATNCQKQRRQLHQQPCWDTVWEAEVCVMCVAQSGFVHC